MVGEVPVSCVQLLQGKLWKLLQLLYLSYPMQEISQMIYEVGVAKSCHRYVGMVCSPPIRSTDNIVGEGGSCWNLLQLLCGYYVL
jgi:hypothetical protein